MRKLVVALHALLILLISACLRAWSMRSEAPGFSEMVATLTAIRKASEYLSAPFTDFCPPLYYAVLHPLTHLSGSMSITLLRLPSVLAGSLACVGVYFVGRWLYGAVAGLLAGYLLALHPLHIYYSQEAQPLALFGALTIIAFLYLVKTAESNRFKDWIIYDLCLVALFYLQREAQLLIVTFPVLQLMRAAFFPPTEEQRRIRRPMLIQAILLNHLLVGALALPWLAIMPNKAPWSPPKPTIFDLLRIFSYFDLRGMSRYALPYATLAAVLIYLLFAPPMLRIFRRRDFRAFVLCFALTLGLLVPFTYSLIRTPRFIASDQALITLPFFVLLLGLLLSRCNPLVRTVLFCVVGGVFASATIQQAITLQKTSWTAMRNEILKASPTNRDMAIFWPDYTTEVGKYWDTVYGKEFDSASASNLLDDWATLPKDGRYFFVVSQFPSSKPHLYTFRGALAQYSKSRLLYQDRMNMVFEAHDLDQRNLSLWYKNPDSLKLLDQPSSQTQFMFTAADPIFKSPQFEWDRPDLTYDAKGRRCVWTKTRHVDLNLTVTLAPGYYVVRIHCSPDFEQPEFERDLHRVVNVELVSGADRRKSTVHEETTLKLSTSTDTELKQLKLSIDTEPMLVLPQPSPGHYGLRIYSIAIDQAESPDAGKP